MGRAPRGARRCVGCGADGHRRRERDSNLRRGARRSARAPARVRACSRRSHAASPRIGMAEAGAPEARDTALAVESLARATGTSGPRLLAYATLADANPSRRAEYRAPCRQRRTGDRPAAARPATARDLRQAPATSLGRSVDAVGLARCAAGEADGRVTLPPLARPPTASRSERSAHSRSRSAGGPSRSIGSNRERARSCGSWPFGLAWRSIARSSRRRSGRTSMRRPARAACMSRSPRSAGCSRRRWPSIRPASSRARATPTGLRSIPGQVDVGRFERDMAKARAARNGAAKSGAGVAEFGAALALYRGDLLPQDGPAEWAVERREHFRREAVEAATMVAEDALASGDLEEAIRVCRRGPRARSIPRPAVARAHRGSRPGRRRGRGEPRSTRIRLDPRGPGPQPGAGGALRLIARRRLRVGATTGSWVPRAGLVDLDQRRAALHAEPPRRVVRRRAVRADARRDDLALRHPLPALHAEPTGGVVGRAAVGTDALQLRGRYRSRLGLTSAR